MNGTESSMVVHPRQTVTCVMPAAGRGTRLMPVSINTPTAMLPIAGQPLISLTINHLESQCGIRRFVIVVGHNADRIEEYIDRTYRKNPNSELDVVVIRQESLDGPLGAVRLAQENVGDAPQLIVLGDTLILDKLEFDRDFVLMQKVADYSRWCLVASDGEGNLARLYDKWDSAPPVAERHALVGVYFISDSEKWKECIEQVYVAQERRGNESQGREYQLSSALDRYKAHQPIAVREAKMWFDCGSIDQYSRTRRRLLQSRSENKMRVSRLGVLHKRSNNPTVLRTEIEWYKALPRRVHPLVPRVFRSSCRPDSTFIDLEYVPVPTLAEYYLYANVNADVWDYALSRILDLWHRYFCCGYERGDQLRKGSEPVEKSMAMYWEKTQTRMRDPELQWIIDTRVSTFRGRKVRPWQELEPDIRQHVVSIARRCHWSLIHGDFHFGNILFDFSSGQLKLIDPRGEFGASGKVDSIGCYGDAHYDLAKFLHSFHGGYAHLSANMFELTHQGDDYNLILHGGTEGDGLLELFREWFAGKKLRVAVDELFLLEGLLFISMLKFHKENTNRQLAEYLIGLQLLTDSLERINR